MSPTLFQHFSYSIIKLSRLILLTLVFICLSTPSTISKDPTHLISLYQSFNQYITSNPNYRTSILYWDINSGEQVGVFQHQPFNPASIIKVPILIEAFNRVYDDSLFFNQQVTMTYTDKQHGSGVIRYHPSGSSYSIYELLKYMIHHSDNTATKLIIDSLGIPSINRIFQNHDLIQSQILTSNLLHADGLNTMTASDMGTLLFKLATHQLFGQRISNTILQWMNQPIYRWGIPKHIPKSIQVANKTGTLNGLANDSGIVFYPNAPYIVVISIFMPNQSFITARKEVAKISKVIYDWKCKVQYNQLEN